jgi:hypothetical protein
VVRELAGKYVEEEGETRAKAEVVTQRGTGRGLLAPAGPSPPSEGLVFGLQALFDAFEYILSGLMDGRN